MALQIRNVKRSLDERTKNWLTINTEKERYRFDPNAFGSGSYGNVHEALDKNKKTVAAKVIGKGNPKLARLESDVVELLKLDHPNVVHMFDRLITDNKIWIFMEYCAYGNLNKYLRTRKLPLEQLVQKIFIPCTEGLKYLHGQNVIHRDIKPDNILVGDKECVKLADYDLSRLLGEIYDTSTMSSFVGAPLFWAPEIHQQQPYKRDVDIFALGLTFLAIEQNNWEKGTFEEKLVPRIEDKSLKDYQKTVPIGSLLACREDLTVVSTEINPSLLSDVTCRVKCIISRMTRVKPEDRPKAAEVLRKLKEKPVKFVESTSWSQMRAHSMCVNKLDQLVVCREGRVEGKEVSHHLTVFNRQDGTIIKQIPTQCDENQCRIMEVPTDPKYILHVSRSMISAINSDTGEEKTVWTLCIYAKWCNRGNLYSLELLDVCSGPVGSVLALIQITRNEKEFRVVKLEWQSDTEEFEAVHDKGLYGSSQKDWSTKMCYVEAADILVFVCLHSRRVCGRGLNHGSRMWDLSGKVAGKNIEPWGVCCDPEGRVYVGDRRRVLLLDGASGKVLETPLMTDGMDLIHSICWSSTSPRLTIHHDQDRISFYTVTTEQ